jgi:hypothetical protein
MTYDTLGGGYATNYRQQPLGGGDIFGGPYSIPTPSGKLKFKITKYRFELNYSTSYLSLL